MKLTWTHVSLVITAIASACIGFLIKRYHLESGVITSGKTEVLMKVTVRGRGGRAVKNAKISVFDPAHTVLGTTESDGVFEKRVLLNSGKSVILQAEGIAFKMRRDLLIPRSTKYQATIFFDLAEVHEGNATLLSTQNSESTSLLNKPTPRIEWIHFELGGLKLADGNRDLLIHQLKKISDTMTFSTQLKLGCKTLQEIPPVHECIKEQSNGDMFFFLVNEFPKIYSDTEAWLNSVMGFKSAQQEREILKTETLFVVRHGGQKIRAYLENMPLQIWKTKPSSTIYRADYIPQEHIKKRVELTVVTEENQVLQKRVRWPAKRRVVITRIPQKQILNLSRRETQQ